MQFPELVKRLSVAVLGIPIIFGAIYAGNYVFLGLLMLVTVVALWEFYGLVETKLTHPHRFIGVIWMVALGIILFLKLSLFIYIVLFIISTVLFELFRNKPNPLLNVSSTISGVFYIGLFYALMLIRQFPATRGLDEHVGTWLVYMIFISIWICDTAAYGFGSWLGKHKLFPRISPNKTWEGAAAGFLTGIMTSVAIQTLFIKQISIIDGLVIGAIVGIAGQLGDLIESMLKRDAQVKDSSALLPGHGGMLDRFDSPILVAPLVYLYLYLRF